MVVRPRRRHERARRGRPPPPRLCWADAEQPGPRRRRRDHRRRPDRRRGRLLDRAGPLPAGVLPRPPGGLEPPPHEARDRRVPARRRLPRLRLVPLGTEAPGRDCVILASLISYPRAVILGLLQGVTELFPISSLGHAVILPQLLGWDIHQNAGYFLSFLVATHLATALVLLGFFWSDWVRIVKGMGRSIRNREVGA